MANAKVFTPKFRASYVSIFEAKAGPNGGDAKYSLQMIFPKTADLSKLKAAAAAAGRAKWGDKFEAMAKNPNFKTPFRDGDLERADRDDYEEVYKDTIFVNANSKFKVGVVDQNNQAIMDPEEFYSGCYAKAQVSFYAYDVSGAKGIACGVNAVKKLAEGDSLGGRVSAESVFANDTDGDVGEFDDDELL